MIMLQTKMPPTTCLTFSLTSLLASSLMISLMAVSASAAQAEPLNVSLESKTISMAPATAASGTVVLYGTRSPAQRSSMGRLIRCDARLIAGGQFVAMRNSCDVAHPYKLPLSLAGAEQPTTVPAGFYIMGFENSVYPGFLQVKSGLQTAVELQQIPIPAGGLVKVYRDTNALTEEFKIYFSTYVLGQSVFTLSEYSFGDLYLKSFGTRDGTVALSYKACEAAKLPMMTAKGARLCKAWNMGTFMTLTEMFNFAQNGSYSQWEVGQQGKPYAYSMGRLLVAKRTSSDIAAFVNVLPGQYVVEVTDVKGIVRAQATGPVGAINPAAALAMNMGWLPPSSKLLMNGNGALIAVPNAVDPTADTAAPTAAVLAASDTGDETGEIVNLNETCSSARMWRTELRAYCTSDNVAGCARSTAKVCEPMFDTP
jgi:hypothetical protein